MTKCRAVYSRKIVFFILSLASLLLTCGVVNSKTTKASKTYIWTMRMGTNPLAPDAVDLTQLNSVSEWLASIKMSRYAESFERAGVTTLEAAARVTVQELTALGITLVGHQKKIMNSVTALRAQMSATSQGFLV
ncbi:Ephrin type-A receptor 7 [Temnothorax longispinosus]|uniref:Ephrin type-A receptor 7 n=1 Tax=Temnothorax longispinosus TaxID=300112 RepID=A0A4S2KF29_9HYME|nr:Ephrin type-A receptor 7 [Temnothorax longispinosus]